MLLGGFDGLHIAHRQLLSRAKESGLPVGLMTIVGGKGKGIFTQKEREDIFFRAGVDFVFELPFAEIKDISPADFIALLQKGFSPKLFVCGEDFRFGAGATGTPNDLKAGGQVCVEVLPLLQKEGEKISASRIKGLLSSGEVERANGWLGERFFLLGKVHEDRKIGRTIGFPTANIDYPKEKFPVKKGVYETKITVEGRSYKSITNFGARPTFDDGEIKTESYLDGFSGNLYGQELKVEFVRYLRDIVKFESAEGLKKQLTEDIRRVREDD